MGQVPAKNLNGSKNGPNSYFQAPSVLIVGSGKLARHLIHYFELLNQKPQVWDRSQPQSLLNGYISSVSTVALAISDDAILGFIETNLGSFTGKIVHFSGARHFKNSICCHPLYTFSNQLYDLETYQKIPFGITGVKSLKDVFSFLSNPHFEVTESQKGLYHACAVASGNFINLLIRQTDEILNSQLNIDLKYFEPYLHQSLVNALNDPKDSLTGPFARRDVDTIRTHLTVLQKSAFYEIYRSFLKAYDKSLLAKVEQEEIL